MRLLFVARAIDNMAGGVERMITTIMNALVARGHQVDLLTWDQVGAQSHYPIDPEVLWHRLDMGDPARRAGFALRVRRAVTVRAIVRERRHEAVICFQDGPFLAMRLYTMGMGIPLIAAERNAPTRFDHTRNGARRRRVVFNGFRFARKIVLQTAAYMTLYPAFLQKRIEVIPNPVAQADRYARPNVAGEDGRYRLLSVGRLGYQKNYQCLIEAFARLAPQLPAWDLEIIGEGEDRDDLASRIDAAGLAQRIFMPGTCTDLTEAYTRAHLFCLASRWEGFPNALGEALAHGLPAVGFADCAGVNELIDDGVTGLLAKGNGNSDTLSASLQILMRDHEARRAMGGAAPETMRVFAPDDIFSRWEQVINKAINP